MAGNFIPIDPVGHFMEGAQQAQRNKLANEEMTLRKNRFAAEERQNQQTLDAAQQKQLATMIYQASQYAIQQDDPKAFVEQNYPQLAQLAGPSWATMDKEGVRAKLKEGLGVWGPKAGIGPAPAPVKFETVEGPRGSRIQRNPQTGEERQVIAPDNSQPSERPAPRFRAMNPQELTQYGLPQGSSAQINDATGQVQVLNKPSVAPAQSAAERKAVIDAKTKLPRVEAAIRRADRLAKAVESVGKNTFMDGGPMDAKALQYTPQGRELMASAAQLMPELQALTRVPGIGSQSDLEARLASLALPSLEMDPQTNARSMAELIAFINDLKEAYQSMAAGGYVPDEAGPVTQPAAGGWSIQPAD